MSDKKAPPPGGGNPNLATLLSVIVLLIAAACIILAVVIPQIPQLSKLQLPTATTNPTTQATVTAEDDIPAFDPSLLILVNESHPLPEDYTVSLMAMSDWPLYVESAIFEDLQAMLYDGMAEGYYFQVLAAYRNADEQQYYFDEKVKEYIQQGYSQSSAEREASLYEQPSGKSDYQTGLSVAIVSGAYQQMDEAQGTTEETRWLHEHCHEYGFVLRYPEGKSSETGIPYKPWHYRYVGREAAEFLTEHNLTLEGYWAAYGAD